MSTATTACPTGARRRRILFVAEAVTLAHVARPVVLARALDPDRFEVHFASDSRYDQVLGDLPFRRRPINSVASADFVAALARGSPLYDAATLRAYVQEDLEILREVAPDLVVGDFRLSLSVSARLARVPYVALSNAYWSPYGRQSFPLPELPLIRILGVPLARFLFRLARPLAFAYHTRPLNRVRREYGLTAPEPDLRRVYTDADYTMYADVPEFVPTFDLPASHHYLGPLLWSPDITPPDWWETVPRDKPIVYVTLGSSGQGELLPVVLGALADLPVSVLAATAGRGRPPNVPGNALVAEYLPGEEASARARLVICNGGTPTAYQALVAGTPVLGIASNMDQYLSMGPICGAGAGALLRAGTADAPAIRRTVEKLLSDPGYAAAAARLAEAFARYHAPTRFRELLAEVLIAAPAVTEYHPTRGQKYDRNGQWPALHD